jgi:hypothetical protein
MRRHPQADDFRTRTPVSRPRGRAPTSAVPILPEATMSAHILNFSASSPITGHALFLKPDRAA